MSSLKLIICIIKSFYVDFPRLLKTLRVVGPNLKLVSRLIKVEEPLLLDFLQKIPRLQFTPVTKINYLNFSKDGIIRRSIKNDKGISFNGGFKVIELKNYSGIPETYNWIVDDWDLTMDIRGDFVSVLIDEFPKAERLSALKSLELKEPITSLLKASVIKGFIVDYGKRDFYIDILTFDLGVIDILEYLPFIRFQLVLQNEEDLKVYFVELYVPEIHFKYTIKIIKEICGINKCKIIVSTDSYLSSKKVI